MARKGRETTLRAPFLKRIWLESEKVQSKEVYPFCLPIFRGDFSLEFDRPITIIVGENGAGKSTILEGIAAVAGFDEAGGGKGYMPVDHSRALEVMGGKLSEAPAGGLATESHARLVFSGGDILRGRSLS
jgi:predicted ATPase